MPYADPEVARQKRRERYQKIKNDPQLFDRLHGQNRETYRRRMEGDPEFSEKNAKRSRVAYQDNPEKVKATQRRSFLRIKYGIEQEDYDRMFEEQGGLCAPCRKSETRKRNGIVVLLSIDHNHNTGKVRALLCTSCNQSIGKFMHDPDLLEAAAKYLRCHAED